jgi:HPt (histidine-containing phosphotransfer) domain-containing protein
MEILRTRFRARCGDRSASLLSACELRDLTAIQGLAHDITGSAGLFGFPSLSEEARNLSDSCRLGSAAEGTLSAARALSASLLRVAEEKA